MIPIQTSNLAPRKRRTFPRGHFEKLESRMVLSTTWAIAPATLPVDMVGVAYDQVINTTDTNSVTLAVSSLKKAIPGITVPSSGTNSYLDQRHAHGGGDGDLHGYRHRLRDG